MSMNIDTTYMGYCERVLLAKCLTLAAESEFDFSNVQGGANPHSCYVWIWSDLWPCAIAAVGGNAAQAPFFATTCPECGCEAEHERLEDVEKWACPKCGPEA